MCACAYICMYRQVCDSVDHGGCEKACGCVWLCACMRASVFTCVSVQFPDLRSIAAD